MVGKVEAPAKANRIELKAGMCLLMITMALVFFIIIMTISI